MRALLSNLLPDRLADLVASLAAYLLRVAGSRHALTAEGRIRGALIGPRHGGHGLYLGRHVTLSDPKGVRLGKGVAIHGGTQLVAGASGHVTIGDHSHISRNSVLAGAGGIEIGRNCMISSGVVIYSVTYDRTAGLAIHLSPAKWAKVTIEDEVHIGAGVTILPGVRVGKGAVIGAGAVVTRDVADGSVVAGVPARSLRADK
jgi:acetyltransferase-like isoleucine patch superfamily enzyme